jgi:hypothetical protein
MDTAWIGTRLAEIYSHPRWIIVNGVSANTQELLNQLREWGAEEVLVVAGEHGVGDQPDVPVVLMPSEPGTVMEGFRRFAARVEDPPPEVRRAVESFDPDGSARALGGFFGLPRDFLGRRLYGARPPEWERLEDKTLVDEIWDEAGIDRTDSEVVEIGRAPGIADDLAGPLGTVWAVDNTEGWHGGGEGTFWVPDAQRAADLADELRGRASHVRVMPFLEGLPCSIHGVVTGDGVAALHPVELLILRRRDKRGFLYAGVANTWNAPVALADEMRRAARRVGEVLRRRHGHRGPFSIDGVATADGFRPTELNPRFSVGYGIQAAALPGLHGGFFVRALVEGDLDVPSYDFERAVGEAAANARAIRMGVPVEGRHERATMKLRVVGDTVEQSEDGAELELGPSPSGGFLFWKVDASTVPQGRPFAPHAAAALRLAVDEWRLPFGEFDAAPEAAVVTG